MCFSSASSDPLFDGHNRWRPVLLCPSHAVPIKPSDPPTSASASAISQAANAKQPCLWTSAGTIYG